MGKQQLVVLRKGHVADKRVVELADDRVGLVVLDRRGAADEIPFEREVEAEPHVERHLLPGAEIRGLQFVVGERDRLAVGGDVRGLALRKNLDLLGLPGVVVESPEEVVAGVVAPGLQVLEADQASFPVDRDLQFVVAEGLGLRCREEARGAQQQQRNRQVAEKGDRVVFHGRR